MLWPEGSQSVIADLGAYLSPALPDEGVRAFALSKLGSYLVVASKSILAMFRLKPLVPLSIYPTLFAEAAIERVVASLNGEYVAVATSDGRVSVFGVQPQGYLEERLKFTQSVTPGPGEAIGAQELGLAPLHTLRTAGDRCLLAGCGPFLLVASGRRLEIAEWGLFGLQDPLLPPKLQAFELDLVDDEIVALVAGVHHKNEWLACLATKSGRAVLACFVGDQLEGLELASERVIADSGVACVDYNARMRALALSGAGRVRVLKNVYTDAAPLSDVHLEDSRDARVVRWTPSGVALLVGFDDGWQLVSMLGLSVYSVSGRAGVHEADFLVSAEAALLRGADGALRVQNMLRSSDYAPAELTRPVLFGNNRLMLYHDPSARGITEGISNQSWLTIPLPTWYMAQNWPLNHVCSTSDGRFVAIAGTVGIMLFSVTSRQWKELGAREFMVRGGMCWFGRRLVAACRSVYDDNIALKMFSPAVAQRPTRSASVTGLGTAFSYTPVVVPPSPVPDSAGAPTPFDVDSARTPLISSPSATLDARRRSSATPAAFGQFELQVLASEPLGANCAVLLVAKGPDALLGVVFEEHGKQSFLVYNMQPKDVGFSLLRNIPLQEVLGEEIPVVRSAAIVNENEVLLMVHSTLYLITALAEANKYERRVVADPIEMFEYVWQDGLLCVFDGVEAVFSTWPLERGTSVATINLDAFPVHFSSQRGVVALVEAEPIVSTDGAFVVARPMVTHEVYVHYLLEAYIMQNYARAVAIATKYSHAPYFAGVLENLLYHCVRDYTTDAEIERTLDLVREFGQNVEAIVANCARKIDMKYWPRLFRAAGQQPRQIFDTCLARRDLKTAAEILIVVQATGGVGEAGPAGVFDLDGSVLELYLAAKAEQELHICRQVCQYVLSVDTSGDALRKFRGLIESH